MRTLFMVCLLGSLSLTTNSIAADLSPSVSGDRLGVTIIGVNFPETLPSDLMSGLQNELLIRITVRSMNTAIERADITITAKYDLWDEIFTLDASRDDRQMFQFTTRELSQVISGLSSLQLTNLFQVGTLPRTNNLVLQADILMNPVEREKMERLRQWVAANSAPRPAVGGGVNGALASRRNDLFNTIFEQYVKGADVVAPWRTTITSRPFNVADVSAGVPPR